ncbi:hypothetical protein B0T16DRAFT_423804 [Cercophora newfieldiana]|uniref:CxC5 like cysteine cluster associated with KDZ domain-containing protein n=1 Tax=Cercophora newfieldiana TaxID=92897 RepID=A0AA39XTB0_9PEZI|nr:hypothetical protein B0T16DRAFT_423804 [Cercophora newfieldiana]
MLQEDVFAPSMGPDNTATLGTFYEIGRLLTRADPICKHLRWEDEYPFLLPDMAGFGLHQRFSGDEAHQIATFSFPRAAALNHHETLPGHVNIHKRLRCALFHKTDCACPDSIAFGTLKFCPRCYTDFAINIVPDTTPGRPERRRFLVFTTWKCLGNGSPTSFYWKPHMTSAEPERSYRAGHAQWCFGSESSSDNTHKTDVDEIHRRVASIRESRMELPPEYTAVVEPGSWVIDTEKEN